MSLEAGTYRARAISATLGEASAKGNIPLVVEFVLLDEHVKNQRLSARLYFTQESNIKRSVESLRYCGYQGDDVSNVTFPDNNQVDLVVEMEDYQGKSHAQVKWINRVGASVTKLSPTLAREFAARMRGAFLKHDATTGTIKKHELEGDDDKAPF